MNRYNVANEMKCSIRNGIPLQLLVASLKRRWEQWTFPFIKHCSSRENDTTLCFTLFESERARDFPEHVKWMRCFFIYKICNIYIYVCVHLLCSYNLRFLSKKLFVDLPKGSDNFICAVNKNIELKASHIFSVFSS